MSNYLSPKTIASVTAPEDAEKSANKELRQSALYVLSVADLSLKVRLTQQLYENYHGGGVRLDDAVEIISGPDLVIPGIPLKPMVVPYHQVERRSMATPEGRAAMVHALCHIEFNAIKI